MLGLTSGSKLGTSSSELLSSRTSCPCNSRDNVRHGTTAIGTEHLDGDDICFLGDTILARGNGTSAVRTVAIAILIDVVGRDSLTPGSTALEFGVDDVDTSVNDVDVNTLTTCCLVLILGESAEGQLRPVADTGETLVLESARSEGTDLSEVLTQGDPFWVLISVVRTI